MIQRIQSLFLLAALIFSGLMIILPFSTLVNSIDEIFKMYFYGIRNITTGRVADKAIPLAGVTLATAFLSFITILIYRRRVLQMRLCVYNILLTFAQIALLIHYFIGYKTHLVAGASSVSFTMILPLVNIFLLFQAFRAIRRDDLLIKSYDRLR